MVEVYTPMSLLLNVPLIVAVPLPLSTRLRPLGSFVLVIVGVVALHVVTVKLNVVPASGGFGVALFELVMAGVAQSIRRCRFPNSRDSSSHPDT
jgi:hypothetical protein